MEHAFSDRRGLERRDLLDKPDELFSTAPQDTSVTI